MNEILKVWFLFSFSLGCWTAFNLLLTRRGAPGVKRTMLVFVALLLLPPLNAYVTLVMQRPVMWLFMLSHQLTWAYGPLLLLLVQQILMQTPAPRRVVLHALPFVLVGLASVWIPTVLNPVLLMILLFGQILAYLGFAARLVYRQRQRLHNLYKAHKNSGYYWLLYLLGALIFATLLDVVIYCGLYFGIITLGMWISITASMLATLVNTIALFALYQPEVFVHEVVVAELATELPTEPVAQAPTETGPTKPAPRVIELSAQAARELDWQLAQVVETHKPHLDEDMSANKLASLLGVTLHQLSELLNVHKSVSFYEFLNDLRYQESLKNLLDQSCDLTIADIAYRSGFNNRNSFYKVFKEKTGVTPAQYKKNLALSA